MRKLEEELTYTEHDSGLLSVDTKLKVEIASSPQGSPSYNTSGNPVISQYTQRPKTSPQPSPQTPQHVNTSPVQGLYAREETYNLRHVNDGAPLPDVTQIGPNRPKKAPMIVQQVVPSPVYVNLAPGSIQQLPDGRVVQLDSIKQVNTPPKPKQTNQPLLIQNNGNPFIIQTSDANFSPVILQSNIINPETQTQTIMYTSAPVQGKLPDYTDLINKTLSNIMTHP